MVSRSRRTHRALRVLTAVTLVTTALVSSSQSAVGILQASQSGNQLIALQTRQLVDLTALIAAQSRAQSLESARFIANQEQARAQLNQFLTAEANPNGATDADNYYTFIGASNYTKDVNGNTVAAHPITFAEWTKDNQMRQA